jgi:hypothetical protein
MLSLHKHAIAIFSHDHFLLDHCTEVLPKQQCKHILPIAKKEFLFKLLKLKFQWLSSKTDATGTAGMT